MSEKELGQTTTTHEKVIPNVSVSVHAASSTDNVDDQHDAESCQSIQWEPGFWKRFPWVGFCAILTMLFSIAMDGVILGTSDGKSREEWPAHQKWKFINNKWKSRTQIEPHVLLAIVNTVTNLCLAIAIAHGVAIAWWRRAMKGSTIADLHKSWGMASSVMELLTAGKKFNYIALAALMAKVALIDNVLLQRGATTVAGWYNQENMEVRLPIAKVLPADYTGIVSADGRTVATSAAFSNDIYYLLNDTLISLDQVYYNETTLNYDYVTGCIGVCEAEFSGFGFNWDCTPAETLGEYNVTLDIAKENSQANLEHLHSQFLEAPASDAPNSTESVALARIGQFYNGTLQKNPLLEVTALFIPPQQAAGNNSLWPSPYLPISVVNKTLPVGSIGMMIRWANITSGKDNRSIGSGETLSRFCSLTPATVKYNVEITNMVPIKEGDPPPPFENGIKLIPNYKAPWFTADDADTNPAYENGTASLVDGQFDGYKVVNHTYIPYDRKYDSNLQEIANFLMSNFGALVLLESVTTSTATNQTQQVYAPNANAGNILYPNLAVSTLFGSYWLLTDPTPSLGVSVLEPTYFIASTLNRLMVRSSMTAATQYRLTDVTNENQTVSGVPKHNEIQTYRNSQQLPTTIFVTHWPYGISAMVVIFVCVLCVIPSYYGFWQLGRKVTLGPIEVAGAFQAPVMDHPAVATRGEVAEFLKVEELGKRKVRYGQVEGQQRLGVAAPTEITAPHR